MADNSATATYRGQGLTVAGWQARAEAGNARPEVDDMTARCEPDAVRLEGESGQAGGFGHQAGDRVPNLNVTRVSGPAKKSGLPDGLQTNPLGRPHGRRGS